MDHTNESYAQSVFECETLRLTLVKYTQQLRQICKTNQIAYSSEKWDPEQKKRLELFPPIKQAYAQVLKKVKEADSTIQLPELAFSYRVENLSPNELLYEIESFELSLNLLKYAISIIEIPFPQTRKALSKHLRVAAQIVYCPRFDRRPTLKTLNKSKKDAQKDVINWVKFLIKIMAPALSRTNETGAFNPATYLVLLVLQDKHPAIKAFVRESNLTDAFLQQRFPSHHEYLYTRIELEKELLTD